MMEVPTDGTPESALYWRGWAHGKRASMVECAIKSREDAAAKIHELMETAYDSKDEKAGRHHFGYVELRKLLDYIYGERGTVELRNPDKYSKR